mmetsp:Transcript_7521/g.19127  ORF Transcript_7521/g.19127 Transcript_7521/m.19127 type:complete len:345 (-) Transcript_7521:149-1183(-)
MHSARASCIRKLHRKCVLTTAASPQPHTAVLCPPSLQLHVGGEDARGERRLEPGDLLQRRRVGDGGPQRQQLLRRGARRLGLLTVVSVHRLRSVPAHRAGGERLRPLGGPRAPSRPGRLLPLRPADADAASSEQLLGLDPLPWLHLAEVQHLQLRQRVHHVQPVVGLLGQRVAHQRQVPQVLEVHQRVHVRQVVEAVVGEHQAVQHRQVLLQVLAHARYPVVVEQQRVQPRQQREPLQLHDLVVAQVHGVELVLRRAQVLDRSDLISSEVDLILLGRVEPLVAAHDELRREPPRQARQAQERVRILLILEIAVALRGHRACVGWLFSVPPSSAQSSHRPWMPLG